MKLQIVPLYHRCVVQPQESVDYTAFTERTKIIIPETTKDKPTQGKVIAVGGGRVLPNGAKCALSVFVGDIVVYNRYAGTEVQMDGKTFIVISEDEISCVLKPVSEPQKEPS